MFSSIKKVNEAQLIVEVEQLLGKSVMKHSKQAEMISNNGNSSLFILYVYAYAYITQREIWDKCGMLRGISAGNLLLDTLISNVGKGANDNMDSAVIEKQQRDLYEEISKRLHKANATGGNNDLNVSAIANEMMAMVAETVTGKKITELQSAGGFDGISKFLIVTKQCRDFDRDIGKLLSKRQLV